MSAAQPQFTTRQIADAPQARADAAPGVLTALRLAALDCRVAARTDLFEACAVLSSDQATARTAHVEVLAKCLAQALGKAPVFHRPGENEMSFDEAWLMRLFGASAADDMDSFSFLIRSRVGRPAQRNLAFLIHRITEYFSPV